ncbi:MarR family transcriptional regulator [Rummeliibacillus sp. G93]|uniref:MarR family winged helix-turn-helix transcriptional regulator n=1 Tax=Rummeliibacillus TaxID=648802 RepID=UPI0011721E10|nr:MULTISPECIES: MarR family transcriptional regulator [Rummeliibacillus]MBB5171374.1 DNA-binding MarR family transcriptional regulator [Rummeliibacillus stabekisii]UQW97227.1 MarR family transcriptional regulator [Rummeliibacillus sp. G93]GEL06390.1 putative HTH-type transcriptional regulator [Rummeliibacillus stabekisii]
MKKNTLGSLIWLRIARFTHQSNLLSNDFLKQFDITVAQFDVLNQVSIYQPITQSQLAEKATLSEGGISRMLTRLEKEGYIQRKQDWKTKWIVLTPQGERKIEEVFDHQLAFQTAILDECLTEEEQKTLYMLMNKLQKHTENKLEN